MNTQIPIPTKFNRGYIGIGQHKPKDNIVAYKVWSNMLRRCYDSNELLKHPTYVDCTVTEEWLNFQSFVIWFNTNYIPNYQLDKDLLVKNNKVYSPQTCCFIPHEINSLLIKKDANRGLLPIGVSLTKHNTYRVQIRIFGINKQFGYHTTPELAFNMYKLVKEQHIKDIANKYKDIITEQTYQALMNYQVEISD